MAESSSPFIAGFTAGIERLKIQKDQKYREALMERMKKEGELQDIKIRRELEAEKEPGRMLADLLPKETEVAAPIPKNEDNFRSPEKEVPEPTMDTPSIKSGEALKLLQDYTALPTTEMRSPTLEQKLGRYAQAVAKSPDKSNVLTALAMLDPDIGKHFAEKNLKAKLDEIEGRERVKNPFLIERDRAKLEASIGKEKSLANYRDELESRKTSKAMRLVKDPDSPTGFSYQDLKGNKIPGAVPPSESGGLTEPTVMSQLNLLAAADPEKYSQYVQTFKGHRSRNLSISDAFAKTLDEIGTGERKAKLTDLGKKYATPDAIKKAFQKGELDQESATGLLRQFHGFK